LGLDLNLYFPHCLLVSLFDLPVKVHVLVRDLRAMLSTERLCLIASPWLVGVLRRLAQILDLDVD
jgi:hypothetical protein